jgi:hypothetical protein
MCMHAYFSLQGRLRPTDGVPKHDLHSQANESEHKQPHSCALGVVGPRAGDAAALEAPELVVL